MIDELTAETASLYVFDLLEPAETQAFARRLESDPELRALVDDLTTTAASLAHTATARPLPPGLEARVLNAIRPGTKVVPFPTRSGSVAAGLGWALAACFAVASFWLWNDRANLRTEVASLRNYDRLSKIQIATLTSKLEGSPDASAVVVWDDKKQRGVIRTKSLPAPPADHDYQLWVVDAGHAKPVDAGVFTPSIEEIDFRPGAQVSAPKAFAVSLERKGGVPEAEGPIVLVGQ